LKIRHVAGLSDAILLKKEEYFPKVVEMFLQGRREYGDVIKMDQAGLPQMVTEDDVLGTLKRA